MEGELKADRERMRVRTRISIRVGRPIRLNHFASQSFHKEHKPQTDSDTKIIFFSLTIMSIRSQLFRNLCQITPTDKSSHTDLS